MKDVKSLKSCPTISTARGKVGLEGGREEEREEEKGRGREGGMEEWREEGGKKGEGGKEVLVMYHIAGIFWGKNFRGFRG